MRLLRRQWKMYFSDVRCNRLALGLYLFRRRTCYSSQPLMLICFRSTIYQPCEKYFRQLISPGALALLFMPVHRPDGKYVWKIIEMTLLVSGFWFGVATELEPLSGKSLYSALEKISVFSFSSSVSWLSKWWNCDISVQNCNVNYNQIVLFLCKRRRSLKSDVKLMIWQRKYAVCREKTTLSSSTAEL